MFPGIHALLDADGLEIGAPELLEYLVVLTQHLGIKFTVAEVEGHGCLILESDMDGSGSAIVIITIVALGIVDEPRLVVEAVLEMIDDQRQHVMVWRDDSEVSTVLGFLETDELFHAQLFVEHPSAGVPHLQHVRVARIALIGVKGFSAKHLTDEIKQRLVQRPLLGEPTDGNHPQPVFGEMLLQSLPHTLSLLAVRHHTVGLIGKQRQLLPLCQQELRLLVQEETVEHCRQQSVECMIEHINRHRCCF